MRFYCTHKLGKIVKRRAWESGWWSGLPAFSWTGLVALCIAGLLGGGCAGPLTSEVSHTTIAQSHLPSDRAVPHHPDSLTRVQVVEGDETVTFEFDESQESIWQDWSATWNTRPSITTRAGDRAEPVSFATLQSHDMALVGLHREMGIEELSKDVALERIEERRDELREFIRIDVHVYTDPEWARFANLDRPGQRVQLRDDAGNQYDPARVEVSSAASTYPRDKRMLHRKNVFLFERDVERGDLLNVADRLRLDVVGEDDFFFTWSLEQDTALSSQ